MDSYNLHESLPFTQLNNGEFCNHFDKHSLSVDEIAKLRELTFNPFSLSNRGRSYLTLNSDLDPDHNYFNTIVGFTLGLLSIT